MKKILIISMLAMLAVLVTVGLAGCGCGVEEEEAILLVEDLVSRSHKLNVVYFEKGIQYEPSGNSNDVYLRALVTEEFVLKSKLLEETRKVFSQSYAQSIIDMAFGGVQSEINQNSIMSRYSVLLDDDWIYVNKDYVPLVNCLPEYDFSTISIKKTSFRFIEATIEAVADFKVITEQGTVIERKKTTIDVVLTYEDGEWRLDSATC